ncbi:MAG: dephospho-CoA kinase [Candidatus Krumholzibacteriota bacterium]|nr:dephospho-CoA kinase [Candidatus Krumholzibacteriota bacterium]
MRAPLIVVTGGIGSGKSTVAAILAGKDGKIIDADALAHGVYDDPALKEKLMERFGPGVFTRSGTVSRAKLGRIVFSDLRMMALLDRTVRPFVKELVSKTVRESRSRNKYIVLDAVLYFQYKFRFRADLVVTTRASERTRVKRIVERDKCDASEARRRIETQKGMEDEWNRAGVTIDTDCSRKALLRKTVDIREKFISALALS